MNHPRPFDEVTSVTPTATGFTADLDPLWTVLGKPNGGYLQAVMARAATSVASHPHVVIATTHYLSAPEPARADLDVEVLRKGRSMSQVRVRLSQQGEAKVETTFGLADLSGAQGPQWTTDDVPGESPVPFEECPRLVTPREQFPVEILHQVAVHLEPSSMGFATGEPSGAGKLRGWVRLPGGAAFDPYSLLLAADVFPPAPFDIAPTGWVPTLELSTYVRALPAPGPVHVTFRASLIQGDRVDETCIVRDSAGLVVAQSHQLAAIRFG
jgi:hypothetical protein